MASTSYKSIASSSRALVGSSARRTPVAPLIGPASGHRTYASPAPTPASPSPAPASPEWRLPEIHLGPTHTNRYAMHYDTTLATDMMYMSYNHRLTHAKPKAPKPEKPKTPYELNRPTALPPGGRPIPPQTRMVTPENIPQLEGIVMHTMVKEAIGNKQALLTAIMALRAISGQTTGGAGIGGSTGVEIVVSKKGAAAFKLRSGMPIAVKVEMRGVGMYDFIQSFVDFVLPRLRDFPGFALPLASAKKNTPTELGGVVSVGLPSIAMGLFPQIEGNLDSYPRLHGFHLSFKTTAKGDGAQDQARALLSGLKIPFYRR